jgi:hypothetical protein
VTSRRPASLLLAAAALLPPALWLFPSWRYRQALSFRDQGDFFFPLKLFTADRIRSGQVPLWNPLSGGGEPWLANLQSGAFYPPTWLFLLASAGLAAALYVALHFAIAAWGAWKLARSEGASPAAALVAAGVFAGCGYAASLSAYWNHFGAWAYLPAIAALARSGLASRRQRLGLAALIGLQAMAGSPEISAASILLALVLAAAFREEAPEGWAPTRPTTSLSRAAVALAVGLLLAAWALVPFVELLVRSGRTHPLAAVERDYGAVGVTGLASLVGLSGTGWNTAYLSSLLLGPGALFCAAAAWGDRSRRRLVLLLAMIAAAGLVLSLEWPPGPWLRAIPPLDRVRYPVKSLAATVLAVSALAAIGADRLRFEPPRGLERLILAVTGIVLGGLLLVSALPSGARLALAASVVPFLLLLLPGRAEATHRAVLQGAGALAVVVSLAIAGRPLFTFVDEAEVRREPEGIRPLVRVAGRVLTPPPRDLSPWVLGDLTFSAATLRREREALMGYTNLLFGISTARTAAALPTREEAWSEAAIDGSPDPARAAGAAGARVLWTPVRPAELPSRKRGDFYETPLQRWLPRLSFVAAYRVEPDSGRAATEAAEGRVDFTREVLLDRAPSSGAFAGGGRKFLVARFSEDRPERVAIEATLGAPGLLVLADRQYPGWVAEVDGKPAPILLANGTFRAVALTEGSHRVVFRYRPLSVYAGAALSAAAWIILLLLRMSGEPTRREALL